VMSSRLPTRPSATAKRSQWPHQVFWLASQVGMLKMVFDGVAERARP
jgi:hypothetical protein